MLKGFKEFISRGNVIDMAIGIIIGGAFTPIVSALTDKVLMPFIAGIFGNPNFDEIWTISVGSAQMYPGYVLTALVNFLLVAAALYFAIIVPMNKWAARSESEPAEETTDATTELLAEIRDLLAAKN